MDILKYIVCLIIAAIIYFIVGLIAWNIVCSWVDMSSCTLVEISIRKLRKECNLLEMSVG